MEFPLPHVPPWRLAQSPCPSRLFSGNRERKRRLRPRLVYSLDNRSGPCLTLSYSQNFSLKKKGPSSLLPSVSWKSGSSGKKMRRGRRSATLWNAMQKSSDKRSSKPRAVANTVDVSAPISLAVAHIAYSPARRGQIRTSGA